VEEKEEPTDKYTINDGLLYYRTDEYSAWRLYLPAYIPFRERVIHDNHDLTIAGHPGYAKTLLGTTTGQTRRQMYGNMFSNVMLVNGQRHLISPHKECYIHFQFPHDPGNQLEWIS
jgi:hypothetical protein